MNRVLAYGLTCLFLLTAAAARATTIVMPSDEALIAKSPIIVDGTVVSSAPVLRDGTVWTDTIVDVARAIKGNVSGRITISEVGGEVDGHIAMVYGTPTYASGERVLLFLEPAPRGGYRTMDLFVGKFAEGTMLDGRRVWIREDVTQDVVLLDSNLQPLEAKNVQRDAARFEQFVFDRVAGREGVKNYGIENPVLAKDLRADRVNSNFTLISDPTVYRWSSFDSNTTAQWYSLGTQTGYSNGGVSELQTAMSSWTGYGSAKIRYSYAGSRSGTPGGLSRSNGYNEVIFGDPLNEISGSWNRSTGGVVGKGGFTGVSGSGNWTAPFAADATHPAGTLRAYNITEGNLVIQDGVSPSAGISSNRLAEIVSHEFGHTLGFGHSSDPTALMYATVVGAGPQLRADDQLAARWLYPNGSTPPPPPPTPPAAPSSLTAAVSGGTVTLRWSDNASNEAGQAIYLAAGSGGFAKVTDVAANAEEATLTGLSNGSYRAYVVATNSAGPSGPSNTVNFTVGSPLAAAFSFTPATGTVNVTNFTFYDESTGATSRVWDFGDGATSTSFVATHVYTRAGAFPVRLTVSNGSSSTSTTKTVVVTAPFAASFTYWPANPTTNDTVTFTDTSTGGVNGWSWTFGDGGASSQQNPTRRFTAPGTYTVTLIAFRNSESATTSQTITVAAPAPVTPPVSAAFEVTPAAPVAGGSIAFSDRSTGSPTSWAWSFGDGGTSNAQNPTHVYAAPGVYTVNLTASNNTGSGTAAKQVVVAASAAYRSLVSVTAQTSGVGGTSWRTELSLFNAVTQGADVTLLFIPGAGGTMITRSLYLAPRQSATYANTLLDLFGMPDGAGALAIEATSAGATASLRVNSRTFTGGSAGTYGQSVPDVSADALEQTLYVTGMQANTAYRTNVGLVNRGGAPVSTTLTLYDADGATLSTKTVTVPANNFQQAPLASFFPEITGRSFDALSMRVAAAASDVVSAYASVINNKSQDPVYIQAVPAPTGSSLMLPVVGRAPGANGTFWRSDVTLFNPTSSRLTLSLRYGGSSKTLLLDSRDTRVLADVLSEYGLTAGSGTLAISWSGTTGPVVTSRTYTTNESGGTYGQSIDPVALFASEVFVPGLKSDGSYRTNVGFVNGGDSTESFFVTLLSPSGTEIASKVVTLEAKAQTQTSAEALFPGVYGGFTLAVRGDGDARLFAYGSMVDNDSGDPVFFAGR